MSIARVESAFHCVTSVLVGLAFAAALCSCGGGGGGGDDEEQQFALPGVRILAVQAAGPGRDLTVTVEISAPVDGVPAGVLALAQTLRLASMAGDVLNDIVTTTSGSPDRNGINGLTPPTTGSIQITFTIAGATPTQLPAEPGVELEVRITDGFMQTEDFFTFDIDPFGPINEPTCDLLSPTGGTVGGQIPVTVSFDDLEGDLAGATFAFTVAGSVQQPCTLVAGSSPFLGGYAPTDPANGFTATSSQVTGIGTPGTIQVLWDSVADGVGLGGRVRVDLEVFTEDGTTMGAGPFSSCDSGFFVDNAAAPPAAMGARIDPLGNAILTDPGGVLGASRSYLGINALLRVGGSGFGAGSLIGLMPTTGLVQSGTDLVSATLLESSLRIAPDGPDPALDETGLFSHLGPRIVTVGAALLGAIDVANHGQLLSLSCDRFTVTPGGTFNVGVQVPSGLQGGGDPVVAFAASLQFDGGAVSVTTVRGGTHADFSSVPQSTPSPATVAEDSLVVFADPVMRTQLAEPVMNVANVELFVAAGVVSGTRIHIWMTPTDGNNVLLADSGLLVFGTGGLSILGTSIVVQ